MQATKNLNDLLAAMQPTLHEPVYVYCCVKAGDVPAGLEAIGQFREAEGLTLIVPREAAQRSGTPWTFACRMITLAVHSSLEAVGFIAVVADHLAREGIACNAVAAYHHDHLFVPEARARDAMAVLERLQRQAARPHAPG